MHQIGTCVAPMSILMRFGDDKGLQLYRRHGIRSLPVEMEGCDDSEHKRFISKVSVVSIACCNCLLVQSPADQRRSKRARLDSGQACAVDISSTLLKEWAKPVLPLPDITDLEQYLIPRVLGSKCPRPSSIRAQRSSDLGNTSTALKRPDIW